MRLTTVCFLLSMSVLFSACTPEVDVPVASSGNADFTTFVVIGDGYMAGYQDGALWRDAQSRSIPAIMSQSMQQVGSGTFNQALMPDNTGLGISSKPWEGLYVTASRMGDRTDCEGVVSLGPVKTFHTVGSAQPYLDAFSSTQINDFAIPFAKVNDLLSANFYTSNVYYNRIAASFGFSSILDAAVSRQPTFFAAWLGMEDIYQYARNGGYNSTILSPANFSLYLDSILNPLVSGGAQGILATIPELESFPFYTLIPWNSADLSAHDADTVTQLYADGGLTHIVFYEGKNGFVIEDPAAPGNYRQMINGEHFTLTVPLDSMKCEFYGLIGNIIHDRYVLDTAELTFINSQISQYNDIIRQKAAQYDLALAEMNVYFSSIQSGIFSQGVLFDAEFVSGGFFGLDGYYPTQKGAALIANQFILAINNHYQSSLPTMRCEECNGVIFP